MNIDIVGGGVAGCASALELAKQGHRVRIWENRSELVAGSSNATPCRLTLGLHYFDKETAIKCLKATIGFVRQYPGFKIIDNKKEATYLKNGWYFIEKGSFYEAEKVLNFYKDVQAEYAALVMDDPLNEVFGSPDQFIRILKPDEYRDQIDPEKVELGIETAECTLDFPRFRAMFIQKIMSNPNIEVYTNREIAEIKQATDHNGFSLIVKENGSNSLTYVVETDFIVNASWENIEALNQIADFAMEPDSRTMRTKCMIEVDLPPSLVSAHSTFVCFGPFCSFTNLGMMPDGHARGFITSEIKTNIESTTELEVSDYSKRLIHGGATEEEKRMFADGIINDVSNYIPAMRDAMLLNVRFGIVKSPGKVDIYSASSPSNQRRESGISVQQFGWISNASMKLLFCLQNAEIVSELLARHEKALSNIVEISSHAQYFFPPEAGKTMTHLFSKYLQRNTCNLKIDIADEARMEYFKDQLLNSILVKQACLSQLKRASNSRT